MGLLSTNNNIPDKAAVRRHSGDCLMLNNVDLEESGRLASSFRQRRAIDKLGITISGSHRAASSARRVSFVRLHLRPLAVERPPLKSSVGAAYPDTDRLGREDNSWRRMTSRRS